MKGEILRRALKGREVNGQEITFTEVAERLGMTPQAFNSKLRAKRVASEFVEKIAKALGTTVDELEGKSNTWEKMINIEESDTPNMSTNQLKDKLLAVQGDLIICQKELLRLHQKLEILQDKIRRATIKKK